MEEDFLLYPEALALKELGFVDPVFAYFKKEKHKANPDWILFPSGDPDIQVRYQQGLQNSSPELGLVSAPTYSQAFKWFRKKYKLHCEIIWYHSEPVIWYYAISKIGDLEFKHISSYPDNVFNTPEEAELEGVKKLIEMVKAI
jgi:hypothetical protein